ncbi:Polyporopepsin [Psilocybe cubensis]|uniref:Peptidase A1 domain-containing protein n=2 Tax=Psilocybe cubensis TaxID=181762 RepID=A0A8H7Y6T4_PSICU|nr:Polyporopepsin [Psilocybe cubensis]KAH9486087.1 Polyporopepsin [Psilocybe cubensis]
MLHTIFLITILVAELVTGNPILINRSLINLPISRRANITGGLDLLKHDRARARYMKAKTIARVYGNSFHTLDVIGEPVENDEVEYIATVGVGSPPTYYSLAVDTGSSNTWIGAGKAYKKTGTSTQTSNQVDVGYGLGSFSGTEYLDMVTLAPGLVIKNQSIGVASTSKGFEGIDGILGIGPVDLTVGTLSDKSVRVPTVTDNLFSQGVISSNEIGISFEPTTGQNKHDGVITWGGTDSTRFTGTISYIPLTKTFPASEFWGIDQSIRYGASTTILSSGAGIVDTGTTLILLATDAFNKYQAATKSQPDSNTGFLTLPASSYSNLESLFFSAGGHTFEFTSNAQIWPRSLNTNIGGVAANIYLIIADAGTDAPGDFVNGFTFLQRFYSVYDTANGRVGLAQTPFTKSTSN